MESANVEETVQWVVYTLQFQTSLLTSLAIVEKVFTKTDAMTHTKLAENKPIIKKEAVNNKGE